MRRAWRSRKWRGAGKGQSNEPEIFACDNGVHSAHHAKKIILYSLYH